MPSTIIRGVRTAGQVVLRRTVKCLGTVMSEARIVFSIFNFPFDPQIGAQRQTCQMRHPRSVHRIVFFVIVGISDESHALLSQIVLAESRLSGFPGLVQYRHQQCGENCNDRYDDKKLYQGEIPSAAQKKKRYVTNAPANRHIELFRCCILSLPPRYVLFEQFNSPACHHRQEPSAFVILYEKKVFCQCTNPVKTYTIPGFTCFFRGARMFSRDSAGLLRQSEKKFFPNKNLSLNKR